MLVSLKRFLSTTRLARENMPYMGSHLSAIATHYWDPSVMLLSMFNSMAQGRPDMIFWCSLFGPFLVMAPKGADL